MMNKRLIALIGVLLLGSTSQIFSALEQNPFVAVQNAAECDISEMAQVDVSGAEKQVEYKGKVFTTVTYDTRMKLARNSKVIAAKARIGLILGNDSRRPTVFVYQAGDCKRYFVLSASVIEAIADGSQNVSVFTGLAQQNVIQAQGFFKPVVSEAATSTAGTSLGSHQPTGLTSEVVAATGDVSFSSSDAFGASQDVVDNSEFDNFPRSPARDTYTEFVDSLAPQRAAQDDSQVKKIQALVRGNQARKKYATMKEVRNILDTVIDRVCASQGNFGPGTIEPAIVGEGDGAGLQAASIYQEVQVSGAPTASVAAQQSLLQQATAFVQAHPTAVKIASGVAAVTAGYFAARSLLRKYKLVR